MNKTWKTQKKLHVSFQSMFFLCGLHNLGKIRPNHWTLRGSDMPRMLCPARCRKVWIRCLNTFENNKCRWYLWLMTLGWNRSTHSMRYHQVYYVCVCASVSLKTVTYRHVVQPDCWHPFRELDVFTIQTDSSRSANHQRLFWVVFLVSIYIYVCVCVLMMISLVPHFLMMLFHVFHHMFSWFSHSFPVFTQIFCLRFFPYFFSKKNLFEQIFFEKKQFPHIFPRFFHGFPRSHGTWRQHWQRRRHATAQLHGQPRGQPRQPRGQRSQSGGLGAMECLGEDIGVCRGLLNVNWSVKSWLNSG